MISVSRRAERRSGTIWTAGAGFAILGVLVGPIGGAASERAAAAHARVRVIDGGPARDRDGAPPGSRLAGVEIRLDPGFLTYWRSPGAAGVAPTFDTSGSSNVASVAVGYPAPGRFDEDGTEVFGYRDAVTFPLVVTPRDPGRAAVLDLALDYAICERQCLPAKAHVSLDLGTGSAPGDPGPVWAALAAVPRLRPLGGDEPVRVDRVEITGRSARVSATTPDGTGTLFAEAPEPWYVEASPARPDGPGHLTFALRQPDPPPAGLPPERPLRLTLVSPAGSVEVAVPLTGPLPPDFPGPPP